MKRKRSQVLVLLWMSCLILIVSASCGRERKKGDENEKQSNLEETGELVYEISNTQFREVEEAKEESESNESSRYCEGAAEEEDSEVTSETAAANGVETANGTEVSGYWTGETSAVVYSYDDPAQSQSQGISAGTESQRTEPEKGEGEVSELKPVQVSQPYYLTEEDRAQVLARLVQLGESYGLTYYAEITESETWDSPTPIYEEDLLQGREAIMNSMVEYTEGAFFLMKLEGCTGFALQIKEYPNTATDAYYEVYVYWM